MKDKIKKLLLESQALDDGSKKRYLRILNFLSKEDLAALIGILETENRGLLAIENEMKKEESALHISYLHELEEFYKREYKNAVNEEEKVEQVKAEEIIKKINE